MTIDTKDMLNSILSSISRIDYVRPDDIPNIDLYMDQVTTFMEKELASSKRHEDDKILTKTMINNYAKNNLLPPPVKKKYSKEHLLIMIFIYYFKNFLSIKDIETMLEPITDKYFEYLLNREKERQNLIIRWEDQMQIFENLAKSFVDFDITGENRSFVKELIIEYNKSNYICHK